MMTVTLLDLVSAVSDNAESDEEVVATVTHLINSDLVRLGGSFRGAHIEIDPKRTPGA
jgi:hypothetical protein